MNALYGQYQNSAPLRFLVSVGGLFLFMILYGIMQESIMTQPYDVIDGQEIYFESSAFLVLINRLVTIVCALFMAYRAGQTLVNIAPLSNYFGASLSNFFATLCQYEALKYVSFPTQTLGKCGKIIPVLVLGTLGLGAKKYGFKDYIQGLVISTALVVFFLTGDTKAPQHERADSFTGIALMLAYLFFDGFTSTLQERMFRGYTMPSSNQMIYVNLSSAILSIFTLIISNQLLSSVNFFFKYPSFMFASLGLSLCAMFGQLMIYSVIKNFGALAYATAMTTRQFVSIVLSCLLFSHPLSIWQILASVAIFIMLYFDVTSKKVESSHSSGNTSSSKNEGKNEPK